MELIVGPRLFSTWSLRPWLVLRRAGAVFDTREVWYRSEAEKAELRRLSPSGFVPLLKVDKGLADEQGGVQLMKPMPDLDCRPIR